MIEIKEPKVRISWDDGGLIRLESSENILSFIQDFFRFFRYIKVLEGNPYLSVDIEKSFHEFRNKNRNLAVKMGENFFMGFNIAMDEMEKRISNLKEKSE
jgi:hypothetical protein